MKTDLYYQTGLVLLEENCVSFSYVQMKREKKINHSTKHPNCLAILKS